MHLRFSLSYYKSHIREALCENIHHGVFFTVVTLRNYHEIRCASYFAIVPYVMGLSIISLLQKEIDLRRV